MESICLTLFGKARNAKKKWRTKALLVDPHKTRIFFEFTVRQKRSPPWIYRKVKWTPKLDN
jgi:hypothetical protein